MMIKQAVGFKQSALYGFLFFFGYFLVSLYWTSSSLFVDIEYWWWAMPFSFAGLPILLCITPALLLGLTGLLPKFRLPTIIVVLIIIDVIRSVLLTGFPWNMPIHGFIHSDIIKTILPLIGFHPLNAFIVLFLCIPTCLLYLQKKLRYIGYGLYSIVCLFIGFYPISQIQSSTQSIPENIVMVQANIPQNEKWSQDYLERNLSRYIEMTKDGIKNDRPHIIIWPETAISQSLLTYPNLHKQFYNFLNDLPDGSYLITGYLYRNQEGHYNSLAVLDKYGIIENIYDKHHLVPFGEYMPLGLDTITGVSNFQSGTIPSTIDIRDRNFRFLPLICYEIIFSSYAKAITDNSIILNITNDAWFGNTAGPYQHFDHAILRAIENRAMVFRLSGNGLSGIILPDGRVAYLTGLNVPAIIKTP